MRYPHHFALSHAARVFSNAIFSLGLVALYALAAIPLPAQAEQSFKIGTGARSGAYFPIGQAIASTLTERGKLTVQAMATSGSLANVFAVGSEQLISGFSQADIASWHHSGAGMVKPSAKLDNLRLIANLYPEHVHVVVRKDLKLNSVAQLKGLRVALDEPGSGVLINARQILQAHGLSERDISPGYIKGAVAAQRMREGSIDALFFVGGVPSSFIATLAKNVGIALLPIEGKEAQLLRNASGFFSPSVIADNAYPSTNGVNTLAVGALWITHAKADEALIYDLTKKMFSPSSLARIQASHPNAQLIGLGSAAQASGLPLHPGAERFFKETGALK
jgi:uncharacterized protein